ncbi:MAG: hypothetical protein ABJ246_10750 [Paracoccaceae bacterium]
MKKTYFVALVVTSSLILFVANPYVGVFYPLRKLQSAIARTELLPYVGLVLWAILPVVLAWGSKVKSIIFGYLSAMALMLCFYLPPIMADMVAERHLAKTAPVNSFVFKFDRPIGVEIHRPAEHSNVFNDWDADTPSLFETTPCFDLCERLLMGGDVAWIRMVLGDDLQGNSRTETKSFLVSSTGDNCLRFNSDFPSDQPCILFAPDHGQEPELKIHLEQKVDKSSDERTFVYEPTRHLLASGFTTKSPDALPVFVLRQQAYDRPTGGLRIEPGIANKERLWGGYEFVRSKAATAPINLIETFGKLGIRVGPERTQSVYDSDGKKMIVPPDAHSAALVASLLAVGPEESWAFSTNYSLFVENWVSAMKQRPGSRRTSSETRTLCAIAKDPRFRTRINGERIIRNFFLQCN